MKRLPSKQKSYSFVSFASVVPARELTQFQEWNLQSDWDKI